MNDDIQAIREYNKPLKNFAFSGTTRDGDLTYPIHFFGGNRCMKSDFPWIAYQLSRLPAHLKIEASREYENLYQSGANVTESRKAANTYLHDFCEQHGLSRKEVKQVNSESTPKAKQALFDKLQQLKAMSKPKPSILGIADQLRKGK